MHFPNYQSIQRKPGGGRAGRKHSSVVNMKGLDDDLEIPISQPAFLLSVLDRHQIAAVNSAAKEIRKNYSKKVSEKLISLIRATLRVLANFILKVLSI